MSLLDSLELFMNVSFVRELIWRAGYSRHVRLTLVASYLGICPVVFILIIFPCPRQLD
ncbi:unnamed protein product [Ectocarpus sp. 6 AP-2014]